MPGGYIPQGLHTYTDTDEAGRRYAEAVAQALPVLGCAVRLVATDRLNLAARSDCVDWLAANPGATAADIEALPCSDAAGSRSRDSARLDDGEQPARVRKRDIGLFREVRLARTEANSSVATSGSRLRCRYPAAGCPAHRTSSRPALSSLLARSSGRSATNQRQRTIG